MLKEQYGIGPILSSSIYRYNLPFTNPNTISVGAKITSTEDDRFTIKYAVVSHKHQKIAAKGDGAIVMCNYIEGKKTPIPEEIRMKILAKTGFVWIQLGA